ncbi:MAG: hypothetical protein AABY43_00850, partial [Candidatus Omnitrophota bacterium]
MESFPSVASFEWVKDSSSNSPVVKTKEEIVNILNNIARSYDFRSPDADGELTDEVIEALVKAQIEFQKGLYKKDGLSKKAFSFVVGYDTRLSSPRIHKRIVSLLQDLGVDVIDIGLVTTPLVYFASQLFLADGGIMITASHNPPPQNGFKPVLGAKEGVRNATSEEIQEIKKLAQELIIKNEILFRKERKGNYIQVDREGFLRDYVDMVIGANWVFGAKRWIRLVKEKGLSEAIKHSRKNFPPKIKKDGLPLKGFKILIDPLFGTSGIPAKLVFEKLGAKVFGIHMRPNGRFPLGKGKLSDPTVAKNLQAAYRKMLEVGADIAIGFDNDGDRLGAVAKVKGKAFYLQGDHIIGSFLDYVLDEFPEGKIVVEVKISYAIRKLVQDLGGKFIETKTGHANIKDKMRRIGAVFGAEQSAHIYPGWNGLNGFFDDSVQAALLLLLALAEAKGDVKTLLNKIPSWYFTPDIRPPCSQPILTRHNQNLASIRQEIESVLREEFGQRKALRISEIDGIKIFFKDAQDREIGWALVRFSGTEAVVSTRVDAQRESDFKYIAEEIYGFLSKKNLIDFDAPEYGSKEYYEQEIRPLLEQSNINKSTSSPVKDVENEVIAILRQGPLTGKDLRIKSGLDMFTLWKISNLSKGIELNFVGRRYLRIDRNIEGWMRLSPSIMRAFHTYTVIGLRGDERIRERTQKLKDRLKKINADKLSSANERIKDFVEYYLFDIQKQIKEKAVFILAGDVVYQMAHSEKILDKG